MWEGFPASVGLILVAEPATRLLFQHGQITAHDASLIAKSTMVYAGAIWAFSMLQIINRAYYAVHDTVTPLVMSVVNIVLNLVIEIPLLWWMGEAAMAVGTLVSFAIQAVVMLVMLDRRVGGIGMGAMVKPAVKMLIATAIMGVVLWALKISPLYPRGAGRVVWSAQLGMMLVAGAAVYLAATHVMGVETMRHVLPKRQRRATDAA
jgi:putative peptidoglycan lipid II flippase